ncbi:hypothetical protein COO09_14375 [Rhizorhabdus dicambivorans]|uniref:Cation-transporting P-type ATPase C-terminal domain-containing protein n=1 Tax=Rhizorhabdus dicambivorans TaxID=1850238 RepID=A0A2A4FUT2_9SPHN|nr:hypothetical protein COO09_14375 [Rhizorhabdus dicambivorans]
MRGPFYSRCSQALLPLVTGLPLLLAPIHIAVLELIIDPACALVFEVEAAEPDVMRRPPRDPHAHLFSWRRIRGSVSQGGFAAGLLALLCLGLAEAGVEESRMRGVMFLSLIAAVLALIMVNRRTAGRFDIRTTNRPLILLLTGAATFAGACLLLAPLRHLLQIDRLAPLDGLLALAVGGMIVGAVELVRRGTVRLHPPAGVRAISSDRRY